jgi:hypothetical protein
MTQISRESTPRERQLSRPPRFRADVLLPAQKRKVCKRPNFGHCTLIVATLKAAIQIAERTVMAGWLSIANLFLTSREFGLVFR